MNTTQLKCFLTVADYLNFAKAAEELNLSQPSVTHQIQSLEAELNTKLFHRSTRSVSLTGSGMAFLDDAREVLGLLDRAKNRFSSLEHMDLLPLNIGCSGLSQMNLLPPVLSRLIQMFPNVHPRFFQMGRTQLITRLDDGKIDISLGMKDVNLKKGPVVYRELVRTRPCCVCPSDYPLFDQDEVSIQDIQPSRLILYNSAVADPDTAALQRKISEGKSPMDLYYCDYPEEAVVMVASGLGVAILPEIMIPEMHDLKAIRIRKAKELSFGFYYKRDPGYPVLREFVQLLQEEFHENYVSETQRIPGRDETGKPSF